MDTILTLQQRAKNSILLGESHFREFKTALEGKQGNKRPRNPTAICREIGEALVAFANADGGELFIGVEDDRTITGLSHNQQDIEKMLNAVNTHILDASELPIQVQTTLELDGKLVLFFSVLKSSRKIFQLPDGRCMRRQDKSSMPASFEQIQLEHNEIISREYDRVFVDGAVVGDLDLALIQNVANEFIRGMSPEQYLQQVNLAEYGMGGLRLKRAALLLFASDISKWFPRCQVRILRVNGDEILPGTEYNVISDEYISGNIFKLLDETWERLRPFLSQKTVFGADAKFEQTFSYPENACREALINAIAHRDYSINNPVTIKIYDNKLEFESPGELLSTISIDNLKSGQGVHESRNTNIARVLRENKYMRELGEGMRRIFSLFQSQELSPPQLSSQHGVFLIAMNHQSIYSPKELAWLKLFDEFGFDIYQKRIIIAGIDGKELSTEVIYSALGRNDRNLYDRSVTTLRISNILKSIRTSSEATKYAKEHDIRKQAVPRFVIVTPDKISRASNVSNKVYVYNLSPQVNQETLKMAMTLFGEIKKVEIPLDKESNQARGFAYVTFEDSACALRAVAIKNIKINDVVAGILPYKPTTYRIRKKK